VSTYPSDFESLSDDDRNKWFAVEAKSYREGKKKESNGDASAPKETDSQPGFRMAAKGLMWSDPSDADKPEILVSGAFEVVAECRDDSGSSWGRLLRWKDPDGRGHEWAMPVSLLAGDGLDVRKALLDGGLYISASGRARSLLTNYLASVHVPARARAVTTTGWFGTAFVFPDGEIGGEADSEHVILQTPHFIDHAYNIRGLLEEWQTNVAKYAEGNSRLSLAISTAFAAALVGPCGAESGGIHLRGKSSVGKTTALNVAGSVWGGGNRGFIRSWRATANGLEGTAAIHSDALLCLDEIAQLSGREAGEVAYMLANGQGKARAARDATLRKPAHWRLLFLSTGEISLADKIAEDSRAKRQTAGQTVRVVDLPSDTGKHGLFEDLHEFSNAASLANHLRSASGKYYGTAARAFVGAISESLDEVAAAIKATTAQFVLESCPGDCDGQVKRVAERFGLVAAAGELATSLEILPWTEGSSLAAAKECFLAWLDVRGGGGAAEDKDGVDAVRTFLSAHGLSRFLPAWEPSDFDPKTPNLAGYRKRVNDGWDFYITSEAWPEVAAGFNKTALSETLAKHGLLIPLKDAARVPNW
jgi:putative DNA primase/helicase